MYSSTNKLSWLEAFVKGKVKQQTIEELPLPFVAVATYLNWGTRVVLDRGPIARAVHASSAIPGAVCGTGTYSLPQWTDTITTSACCRAARISCRATA